MIPKVFVSHASEDKERFVLKFATKLRDNGIDAWVDKWEMLPGDSLVDKIFEEGIKNAQAIIIIISKHSIKKPWVREELNAGMIKRITTGTKLIPVIIDDCDIPECLKTTVWQPIKDINNYDEELNRVIMSISGETSKPPIGQTPKYIATIIDEFPSLTKVDSIVFKIACENVLKNDNSFLVSSESIFEKASKLGIDKASFLESLEILDGRGYINARRVTGGNIPLFTINVYGFNEYVKLYVKDFDDLLKQACFYIVNSKLGNCDIALKLNKPVILVNHMFNLLKQKGLIDFKMVMGGEIFLIKVSPELKRMLQ